jgi:hypothetical protein
MDKLLACLVAAPLLLAGCQTPEGFVEGARLGIVARSPVQFPVIFVNSHTGEGLKKFPENEWATVDVSGIVPPATKAVYLSGLLIITHGTVPEVCDLTLAYRNYEDGTDYTYVAQTIATELNGGQRTPHSIWIPVREGNFEMKWRRSTVGDWPEHCAYGINLNLVAYLR